LLTLLFFLPLAAADVDLLVQGALDAELQPLLQALDSPVRTRIAAWTFWRGRIGAKTVVISRTDVGPINAAAATTIAIREFRPKAIINQGTAGGHNRRLKLWDIVIGEKTTDFSAFQTEHGDEGTGVRPARWRPMPHHLRVDGDSLTAFPSFPGDPALVAAALRVPYSRGRVVRGAIGSAYQYIRELDHIRWLNKTYGTDSEDMESAYAAGVAVAMKVPFVAIRIISDTEWEHPTFEIIAGEYGARFVVDLIRRLP